MMKSPWYLIIAFACCYSAVPAVAQDLHWSQPTLQSMQYNPALTGLFRGYWRGSMAYRSQWNNVPVPYSTLSGAFEWKALRRSNLMVATGMALHHDRSGDAGLSWTQVGLTGNVARQIHPAHTLAAGFGLHFVQRSFDLTGLTFQNQWTGDLFDPNASPRETLRRSSGVAPSIAAGFNWHFEPSFERRTRIDAGVGTFHLNQPLINFQGDAEIPLPVKISFFASSVFQINRILDINAFATMQRMQTNKETIIGIGLRSWLSMDPGRTVALEIGLAARPGDALIPALQLLYNEWNFALSYDVNTSAFQVATLQRGGYELVVGYRPVPAPPLKISKSCPIF
jgi:type IX secretion system PorP/SprF family membrane protein